MVAKKKQYYNKREVEKIRMHKPLCINITRIILFEP